VKADGTTALSTKAYSISTSSVWNSLSYTCNRRSAELLSTFNCSLELNCSTLPIVDMNTQPSLCHYAPLIRLQHVALHTFVLIHFMIDWWAVVWLSC